jgi:hypothetical protein
MKEKNKNKIKLKKYLQLHLLVKSNLWMFFFKILETRGKATQVYIPSYLKLREPTTTNLTILPKDSCSLIVPNKKKYKLTQS